VPYIHERDLAAIIATALRDPAWDSQIIHAAGRPISDRERAHILCDVLGRTIVFAPLTRAQAERRYQERGLDEQTIAYLLDTAAWFAEHTDTSFSAAERLLGRPLTSYAAWAREHVSAFRPEQAEG
jgi:nucleoside-diphosphate-sugar epimerase